MPLTMALGQEGGKITRSNCEGFDCFVSALRMAIGGDRGYSFGCSPLAKYKRKITEGKKLLGGLNVLVNEGAHGPNIEGRSGL